MWSPAVTAAVLAVLLRVCSQQDLVNGRSVCYVNPQNNTTCPYHPCYTLQEYVEQSSDVVKQCRLGEPNTVYRFLGGASHHLFSNISLQVNSVSLLGRWGEGAHAVSHAEIVCEGSWGILFHNSHNIVISHLTFTECGYNLGPEIATLAFKNMTDLKVISTTVRNGSGYGLYAGCVMGHVEVNDSEFAENKGLIEEGGNCAFFYKHCPDIPSLLSINNSRFLNGYSRSIGSLATGLYVFIWTNGVNVEIDNITAVGNRATGSLSLGGNVALLVRNRTTVLTNWVVVKNSYIADGEANTGGGIYLSFAITPSSHYNSSHESSLTIKTHGEIPAEVLASELLRIESTHIVGNHATHEGGGLYLITHEDPTIFQPLTHTIIRGCVFTNNSLKSDSGGGVALHLANHYVLGYLNHSIPQFYTLVINCTIERNFLVSEANVGEVVFTASSALFLNQNPSGVLVEDSRILNNSCTGISVVESAVIVAGEVVVAFNNGTNGGGFIFCDGGYMLLRAHATLLIKKNSAIHAGGGIYTEDSCLQSKPPCFFQLDIAIYRDPSLNTTIDVQIVNNTASYAGSAIFGGSVVYCYLFPQFVPDLKKPGQEMFKQIFSITHPASDLSPISSEPYKVCFCSKNYTWPDCSIGSIARTVYPGETLTVFVFSVGQHSGSAAHAVTASLKYNGSQLGELQFLQDTNSTNCTQFNYTVFSQHPSEVISLQVHHLGIASEASQKEMARIHITFNPCPVGFSITENSPYKCGCVKPLNGYQCDINRQVIKVPSRTWIGIYDLPQNVSSLTSHFSNNITTGGYSVQIEHHCPYDFCTQDLVEIHTGPHLSNFSSNALCAYHREGVLCGACKEGYSLIFGNAECRRCTNSSYLFLILVFAGAGVLLVLLLVLTDLSVSSGLLSGVLFYANLVQVNSSVFFGKHISDNKVVSICSIFIAWLNLDFGFKTCFYNGMDAYMKTWLQFAFPFYVWGIAIIIILLSRRFPSNYIAGRSPVRLLATLFILSYAKLLRTIIRALAFNNVSQWTANGHLLQPRLVWREDGNFEYLHGKYIPLFVFAIVVGLVTLPYTLVLLCHQWLLRGSHWRCCSLLVRLKPLFDAYTAPYKPHCRFWTGFLLLMRVLLFLAFSGSHVYPAVRLSLIITACIVIQMMAWSLHGVFRNKYMDSINSVLFLNLGLFSAVTSYNETHDYHQVTVIIVSVGATFALFVCILLYHVLSQIKRMKMWSRFELWLRDKLYQQCPRLERRRRRRRTRVHADSDLDSSGTHVTQTFVDPFDIEYREPLVSSNSNSYESCSDQCS